MLVLRAPSWDPHGLIPSLELLITSSQQQQPQLQVGQQQLQDAAIISMLKVLASLPTTCTDHQCSVHPNRRLQVSEALAASSHITKWIVVAFDAIAHQHTPAMRQLHLTLGMSIIHGWAELGALPLIMPQHDQIVQQVCMAVLRPETTTPAAETLVSMLTVCKDVAVQGSDVLPRMLTNWQGAMQQLMQQQQAWAAAHGMATFPKDILQAACSVLCAAGSALLSPVLAGDNSLHSHFAVIAEQLLLQLTSQEDDVSVRLLHGWCREAGDSSHVCLPTPDKHGMNVCAHLHLP